MDVVDQCIYEAHIHDISEWWYYDVFVYESYLNDLLSTSDATAPSAAASTDLDYEPGTWKPPEPLEIKKRKPDYARLRPLFGWLDSTIVQKTFENTTQYGRLPVGTTLKRMFKSANPASVSYTHLTLPTICSV